MVGRTLGHYRVLEMLGKGGMGEVYRAHDEVLGRDVAIKVLPEELSTDPERLARFEREAKVLAALNHPHIGAIYGLEKDDGQHFLVLELIEGETLADWISRSPIPVREAVSLAIQIADGLEVAHEKGMVHRDLKPANIKITPDGEVKVLDFGLAKPTEAIFSGDLSESPTLTYSPTGVGVILGTAAYMSPEQVRGKEVDRRTDVWAFGVVLWEMLTGKKLFQGDTVSDVLASTLTREPEWEWLPTTLPAGVRRVLRHCLVQEPKERLHDIADARIELQEALDEPEIPAAVPPPVQALWKQALPWVMVLLALVGGWLLRPMPEPEPLPVLRFEVPLPKGERLTHFFRHGLALSPDGSQLAFVVGEMPDKFRSLMPARVQIYLRDLGSWQALPITGSEGRVQPTFSPDGKWLAVIAADPYRLERLPVAGGEPELICECLAAYGAAWGPDDSIVFAGLSGGLQRVSAFGGIPEPLTSPDEDAKQDSHRLPHFLPGGQALLFTATAGWTDSPPSVYALSLADGSQKLLLEDGSDARYVPPGHLVFARQGRLVTIPFDSDALEITGPEIPLKEEVGHAVNTPNLLLRTLAAQFAVSPSGTLVYDEGSVYPSIPRTTFLVDRRGGAEPLGVEPRDFFSRRVSDDGQRTLMNSSYPPEDAWIYDRSRGTLTRQTFDGETGWAIWGPGPTQITFSSDKNGVIAIYTKHVDQGPGGAEKLTGTESRANFGEPEPSSWHPEGNVLALVVTGDTGGARTSPNLDIWIYSVDNGVMPFVASEFSETYPEFSPDGRWLAYLSNESGRERVYVRPFPGPGPAVQISNQDAIEPSWSRDGSEIFYRSTSDGFFMSADVKVVEDKLVVGSPARLFDASPYRFSGPVRSYGVSPGGSFVLIASPDETAGEQLIELLYPTRIRVVQNWAAELEEKVPR